MGVQRQYCGRLGKLENCQVAVFLAQGRGERVAAADFRLFLPEAWVEDAKRCAKAKVPEGERRHRTKTELALEMIQAARERGSRHAWIGGDEVYGNNDAFTATLEDMGEVFLMDVAANHRVWTSEPRAPQPAGSPRRGRPFSRLEAPGGMVAVAALADEHFEQNAREMTVRATPRGPCVFASGLPGCGSTMGQSGHAGWSCARSADGSRKIDPMRCKLSSSPDVIVQFKQLRLPAGLPCKIVFRILICEMAATCPPACNFYSLATSCYPIYEDPNPGGESALFSTCGWDFISASLA